MSGPENDKLGQEGPKDLTAVREFLAQMTEEERMLVILNSELYQDAHVNQAKNAAGQTSDAESASSRDGWQAMLDDLDNRLQGKPYIFKLAHRIADDIARIKKLRAFEQEHHVKLSDYVKIPSRQKPEP